LIRVLLLFILIFSQGSLAKSKKTKKKKKVSKNIETNFADKAHATISNSVINLADSIDTFFGDERIDAETNGTRIRVFTLTSIPEGETATTEGNFLIRLSLPRTENKLQLVLSRDEEDQDSDDGNPATTPTPTNRDDEEERQETRVGLRFLIDKADVNFSTDLGIRAQIPPIVFANARIRKNIKLDKRWVFRPMQRVEWVQEEGFSARTRLDFDRKINDAWLFRFVNNVRWNDQDYRILLRDGPTFLHKINDKIGMSYNAFVVSESSPKSRVENYILSIGYRQLLYKKWFFWEISPSLSFSRQNNFHRSPGWLVKFEAIVGSI
jgi:hypothetical protein